MLYAPNLLSSAVAPLERLAPYGDKGQSPVIELQLLMGDVEFITTMACLQTTWSNQRRSFDIWRREDGVDPFSVSWRLSP